MKFLVVGLGSMGKRRIRNLKHLNAGEIIGYDPSENRRREAVEKYQISAYETIEAALAEKPTAFIISTPPDKHMIYGKMAAERGLPFFCEAGTSAEGVAEVIEISRRNGSVAAPSCTLRFQPSIKKMKSLIDEGALGRVLTYTHHCGQYLPDWHPWEDYRSFYGSRRETGACREIVPFELNWLTWLVGEVASVSAIKAKLTTLDCDIDDVYHLLMHHGSHTIGHLMVDVIDRSAVRHCRILGEKGTLDWSFVEKRLRHYDASTGEWKEYAEPESAVLQHYSAMSVEQMYIEEMNAFVRAATGETPYPYSFTEDVGILNVLEAAELASNTERSQPVKQARP
jgi:predicted dehydrogenase